jgi:predicted MFS family arabinose efflux permease
VVEGDDVGVSEADVDGVAVADDDAEADADPESLACAATTPDEFDDAVYSVTAVPPPPTATTAAAIAATFTLPARMESLNTLVLLRSCTAGGAAVGQASPVKPSAHPVALQPTPPGQPCWQSDPRPGGCRHVLPAAAPPTPRGSDACTGQTGDPMDPVLLAPPRLSAQRARIVIATIFAVHGVVFATFATRIPWLQDRLGLSAGSLGAALLFGAIGGLLGMPFASRVLHRFGGRRTTRALMAAWCIAGALPVFAPNLAALIPLLLLYGMTSGMADVAMNAQAIPVERDLGKSIMSGLHGMWSVGGIIGSAVGAAAAHAGLDARIHLAIVDAALLVVALGATSKLPVNLPDAAEQPPKPFVVPSRGVLLIGLVAFCAIFAEAASSDWCAVYLTRITGADPGIAAASYTAFACTMAAARFGGDFAVRLLGLRSTVRIGGMVGTLGALLVVAAFAIAPTIVGFALIGLGIAVTFPLAVAAAGHADPIPARGISGVATISYGAGIAAPGIIGGIADAASLQVSFGVVAAVIAFIAVGARYLR